MWWRINRLDEVAKRPVNQVWWHDRTNFRFAWRQYADVINRDATARRANLAGVASRAAPRDLVWTRWRRRVNLPAPSRRAVVEGSFELNCRKYSEITWHNRPRPGCCGSCSRVNGGKRAQCRVRWRWRIDGKELIDILWDTTTGSKKKFFVQIEAGIVVNGEVIDAVRTVALMLQVAKWNCTLNCLCPEPSWRKLEKIALIIHDLKVCLSLFLPN